MLPVQFILLLILSTLPGEMGPVVSTGKAGWGAQGISLWVTIASLYFSQLCVVLWVWQRTRGAIHAIHQPTASIMAVTVRTDALFSRARWLTLLITGIHLFSTSMPPAVYRWFDHSRVLARIALGPDGHVPLLPELFFIAPAVLAWLGIWTAAYFVESAAHERRLPFQLATQQPVHVMPSLGQFLSMQSRHNFFPAVFLLIQALFTVGGNLLARWFPDPADPRSALERAQLIASVGGTIIVLLILPWLLIRLWMTVPLLGPLRQRLDYVAALYRLRFRNILLWRTHNMVINAAILGWVPFARYFLMSDSLLEAFSDRQLEAVFAHEVGHGVHRHIPWYLATIGGAMLLAGGMTGIVVYLFHIPSNAEIATELLLVVLFCLFGGATLPFIAPRFEHQADWFACRHMARMLEENPALLADRSYQPTAVMSQVDPVPAEVQWSLSTVPTKAETVTIEEYIAGQYPHAGAAPPAATSPAAPASSTLPESKPQSISQVALPASPSQRHDPALAGAEIFISALDAIVETSHRARDRRGWMHPSINDRIALLRELAANSDSAERFERLMVRTRLFIAALLIFGIAASAIAYKLPDTDVPPATQPGSAPAHVSLNSPYSPLMRFTASLRSDQTLRRFSSV